MTDTFEQRLLAYLDGMLDARSRHAFLSEVARDPEKRKLLDQYRQLDARLRDRGNPIAVPLRTQQALAQRIPSLSKAVPQTPLPPAGAAAPATGGRGLSALSLAGRRIIGLLLAGGLVTVGLSLLDSPWAADRPSPGPAMTPAQTPPGAESQAALQDNAPENGDAAASWTDRSQQQGGADIPAQANRQNARQDREADSPALRPDRTAATPSSQAPSNTGRDAAAPRSVSTPPQHALAGHPASIAEGTDDRVRAEDAIGAVGGLHADDGVLLRPFTALPAASLSREPQALPTPRLSDLLAGRLHLYLETGATPLAGSIGGPSAASDPSGLYLAGLRYQITHALAAGLDLGRSRFSRERLEASSQSLEGSEGGTLFVIDRVMHGEMTPWLRLHAVYALNPEDRLRFETDAGGGILFTEGTPVMLSTGASLVYALSTSLQLRAGMHATGAWMQPAAPLLPAVGDGSGVIGIIRRASAAQRVFTTTLDLRIGFGILLW